MILNLKPQYKKNSQARVKNCRPLDKFTLTGIKRWLGAGYGFGKF